MTAALFPEPTAPIPSVTERHMLDLLYTRYNATNPGNGPRYVRAEHVRSHAGFDARRTADFMALDLWPSKGLQLHGHEVKTSRADWLCELADPTKAEEFRRYCDRWWLVVPDARIVRDDLPPGWGLIVGTTALKVRVQAPRLSPEPLPRGMQACLLRAAVKLAERPRRAEAEAATTRATETASRRAYLDAARSIERATGNPAAVAALVQRFRDYANSGPAP